MSRHRNIRNLTSEDLDDYAEDDNYEEEEESYGNSQQGAVEEMTEEQKAQMQSGYEEVRRQLPDETGVTRADIEDALWYYYFDVQQSVKYLSAKTARRTPDNRKDQSSDKRSPAIEKSKGNYHPEDPNCRDERHGHGSRHLSVPMIAVVDDGSKTSTAPIRRRGGHIQGCARRALQLCAVGETVCSGTSKHREVILPDSHEQPRQVNLGRLDSPKAIAAEAGSRLEMDSPTTNPVSGRARRKVGVRADRERRNGSSKTGPPFIRNVFDIPELLATPSAFATAIFRKLEGLDSWSALTVPHRPLSPRSLCGCGCSHALWCLGSFSGRDEIFSFATPSPDDVVLAAQSMQGKGVKRAQEARVSALRA